MTIKLGSKVKIKDLPLVQIKVQNAHGYIKGINGHIAEVIIHDHKRPSIDGTTVYVNVDNLEAM